MRKLLVSLTLMIPAAGLLAAPASAADPVAGKSVFARCTMCHSTTAGQNRLGPSLAGIVGRKAGTVPGFNYSAALKSSGVTWTPAELDAYLVNPKGKLPGIKMIFNGLPKPEDRANLIAYLTTLK